MNRYAVLFLFSCMAVLIGLTGCEAVFTYSPVAFLARNSDSIPASQKTDYYENLAASGGLTEDNLSDLGQYAQENADNPEINKLAGTAYIEASGIETALSSVIEQMTSGEGVENIQIVSVFTPAEGETVTGETISAAFTDIGVNVDKIKTGSDFLSNAEENGAELSEMDYVIGGVGLALGAVEDAGSLAEADKAGLDQALDTAGSFNALAEQVESGESGLSDAQVSFVTKVKKAQDYLSSGMTAIETAISGGGTEGEGEAEGEGNGEEQPAIPEGMDISNLFEQLLQ